MTNSKVLVLFDQAIVSGGNFALGILMARLLGLETYGLYCILWMGILFALNFHQAFMTKPLMSLFASKKEAEQATYLKGLFGLQFYISAACMVLPALVFGGLKILNISDEWVCYVPLCGFLTAVYLLQDFLRKSFFVKQQYHQPVLMDLVLYVPMLLALPTLYYFNRLDLNTSLWVMVILYTLSSGLGFYLFWKKNWTGTNHSSLTTYHYSLIKISKEHYHYSFWLLGTSLVQWFSSNFFLIAAASVLGTMAVGALRMAQNMVGLCHVLFLAMENIIPAKAAQHFFDSGKTAMYVYLKKISFLGSLPILLMLGGLTFASLSLIEFLYGAEYQSYSYLVGAYALLYIFVYIGFPLRFALRTLQYTSPTFIAYCLSAGTSMLIAFPMAEAWGIAGIIAGLIGTQILTLLVYIFFLNASRTDSPSYKYSS